MIPDNLYQNPPSAEELKDLARRAVTEPDPIPALRKTFWDKVFPTRYKLKCLEAYCIQQSIQRKEVNRWLQHTKGHHVRFGVYTMAHLRRINAKLKLPELKMPEPKK